MNFLVDLRNGCCEVEPEELNKRGGGNRMKYKVIFNKWAYVEANSEDEAIERAVNGDTVYEEEEPTEASEVDEFFVEC